MCTGLGRARRVWEGDCVRIRDEGTLTGERDVQRVRSAGLPGGYDTRTAVEPGGGPGSPSESYAFGAKLLAWEVVPPLLDRCSPLRTSHLRDPLGPEVHFGSEQFIDEIAAAVKADPVEFRLQYIAAPRDAAIVKAAAEKAGWTPRRAPAHRVRSLHAKVLHGRGIAYAQRSDTVVAVIADIEVYPKDGRIWARKFTVAHDCGLIINPKSLRQTIEGNVVQGLSRTLFEEVHFDRNTVKSVDWASYRSWRFATRRKRSTSC